MADENLNYDQTLDEIVFEHRNKAYGAYDLRKSYPKLLTRSFIIGTVLFIILAVSPLIYLKIQEMNAKDKVEVDAKLVDILEEKPIIEEPKEEEPPPPPPKVEQKQEVIQNVVPEPKRAPKIETPPPTITEQLKTTTGLNNQEGVKTPAYTPPPPPPGTGKVVTAEVKVTNEVYESVDQNAEFQGGINAFRTKFQNNFDQGSLEGEGALKTEITFVVEKDGSLTQVKATGSNADFNRAAEETVRSIKTKWTPGKVNGQPVRSRFRFPVTMNFQ
ncbi:MAG: energy transducer TonB [Weeksellaceae bacterium]|nr:energy transducer TonB [Weeksellaceae bacterium]